MITYDLVCEKGHKFEGWFENSADFESQYKQGLIKCPHCDSSFITRELSPVGYIKSGTSNQLNQNENNQQTEDIEEQIHKLSETIIKLSDYVETNYEDVGSDFTNTALKIHYGVEEPKNIRGTATENEEKLLKDEGINFLNIPTVKKRAQENDN